MIDADEHTVDEIQLDNSLNIPSTALVKEYGGVMDQEHNIVHVGNSVKLTGLEVHYSS